MDFQIYISSDLVKKILGATHLTGEEMRIILAHFVFGGNIKAMSEHTQLELQTISKKTQDLKNRGHLT